MGLCTKVRLRYRSAILKADILAAGELQSVDGYMNIALEKTEEHVNGVKKRSYGDAFVRGNNGKLPEPLELLSCTNEFGF